MNIRQTLLYQAELIKWSKWPLVSWKLFNWELLYRSVQWLGIANLGKPKHSLQPVSVSGSRQWLGNSVKLLHLRQFASTWCWMAKQFHQFLLLRALRQMSTQSANQISPWWYPSTWFQNEKASFSRHLLICSQYLGSPESVLSFLAPLDLVYYTQGFCLLFSQPQLIIIYY